jgi:dipeptidyl aminopeptidase/acylaminoacyl peptidase
MTRPVRPARSNPPRARDPYGIAPLGPYLAPALSALGLVIIGVITFSLLNGAVPFGAGSGNGDNGDGGVEPGRTAAPSNVVVVPEEAAFEGSIVYAKGGNVWIQTDEDVRQLTDSGRDSMPSWSADGQWVYYIHTTKETGQWPAKGVVEQYQLDVPNLMRIKADGSGGAERLKAGRIKKGDNTYAYWMRQPVVSPDGSKVAMISDAPDPDDKTPVLQYYDPATDKITDPGLPTDGVLGHQDPEWRPDGKRLVYVRNARDGSRGASVIVRTNPETGRTTTLTSGGYLYPAYSPDGRYLAATRSDQFGTNVVILDGESGEELLRITNDGASWAPTWSPAGDAIAFLHLNGQTVDLRKAELEGTGPAWTVADTIDLTEVSGLEPASKPDWFIPADQLPASPPPATPAASGDAASAPASATPAP